MACEQNIRNLGRHIILSAGFPYTNTALVERNTLTTGPSITDKQDWQTLQHVQQGAERVLLLQGAGAVTL